ncbi:unnamed protein product [Miscanthus lutarioriparius]|uniref:C2H2-type domain-containing protein n=1 Tax=Miscanthus lutarioriparius TaxID=422564 RepID=A0A811MW85_9POAL|nr:unnamed protein product [Miscanthus lutarioriparius]
MAEAVLDAAAATPWPRSRQQIQDDEGTVVHAQPRCAADGPAKRKRKTFPTGQALGGHKRCHYEGSAGAATTALLSSRGFDLNVPALPDLMVDADWCMLPPAAEAEEGEEVLSPLAFKKPRLMIMS